MVNPPGQTARVALPETVTAEALAARSKQPAAPRKQSSDHVYKKTARKWWPLFLKEAGWTANDKDNFLDTAGEPRDGIFQQLFIWLYEQPNMTKGVYKPMLAWAQARLNEQRRDRMLKDLPAYVCSLPGIKERKDEIYTGARHAHMEAMVDLQAAVESDIGFEAMDRMARRCLGCKLPDTSPMFTLQTYFELRATHQQAARHDDLRTEVFAHMFARMCPRVGPNGLPMLCNVTDGGKTNKNGRISYSAVLPHRNPLLCTMFAKGAAFMWRWRAMGVPFPDLLNPEDIFNRHTLRQGFNEMHQVSYDSSYKIMKRLYESENVVCTKVLHQGRGECQRELDDDGVHVDQIKRLCKYIHDEQNESYLLNPPLAALLSTAGFDHEAPRSATAAHLSAAAAPSAELIKLVLPKLLEAEAKIEAEFATVTSGAEAAQKRLFCARGCARALRLLVEMFLRCSAARPRNKEGHIISDSEPIFKLFCDSNALFQQNFFAHELFLHFAGQVKAAEERELAGASEETEPATGLTPISARLDSVVRSQVAPIRAQLATLLERASEPGPPATPAGPSPQAELQQVQPGKRRSVHEHAAAAAAKRGATGIPVYVLSSAKTTVKELWEEYTTGLNGNPAVRTLVEEHGTKWRSYKGGRKLWYWHKYIYDEILARTAAGEAENAVLDALQERLVALTKAPHEPGRRGRKPAAANWQGLAAELAIERPRAKRAREEEGGEDGEEDD